MRPIRRKMQMVYQDPTGALNPRQTIYESVAEGLRIHRVPGDEEKVVAQRLGQRGRIAVREEHAVDAVAYHVAVARDVGRDDRRAAGER